MLMQLEGYLVTALMLTAFVPVFGIIMDLFTRFLCRILAAFIGARLVNRMVNYLTFPGVVHHELSHALLVILTGGRITELALFKPDGNTLGHVSWQARGGLIRRSIQKTFCAIAPVVLGSVSTGAMAYYINGHMGTLPLWQLCLLIYLAVSVFLHMTMSPQDLSVMWSGIFVVYLLVLLIVLVFRYSLFPAGLDLFGLIAHFQS